MVGVDGWVAGRVCVVCVRGAKAIRRPVGLETGICPVSYKALYVVFLGRRSPIGISKFRVGKNHLKQIRTSPKYGACAFAMGAPARSRCIERLLTPGGPPDSFAFARPSRPLVSLRYSYRASALPAPPYDGDFSLQRYHARYHLDLRQSQKTPPFLDVIASLLIATLSPLDFSASRFSSSAPLVLICLRAKPYGRVALVLSPPRLQPAPAHC